MTDTPVILTCTKTGRHWHCASDAVARRRASILGLVDYEIAPAVPS